MGPLGVPLSKLGTNEGIEVELSFWILRVGENASFAEGKTPFGTQSWF